MKKIILGIFALGALASGCASSYTSIRQLNGNTYVLTRVNAGLFGSTNASLVRCEAANTTMRCTEAAEP